MAPSTKLVPAQPLPGLREWPGADPSGLARIAPDAGGRRPVISLPIEIDLPSGDPSDMANAAEAVKREYRSSVKWKKLRCRDVVPTDDGSVFKLDLGQTVEFDWTWEGATAFRPATLTDDPSFAADPDEDGWAAWSGEVVEVDEARGEVFVWVSDPDRPPTRGTFFVRPFEFLAYLHDLYAKPATREYLAGRLHASLGNLHPRVPHPSPAHLPHLAGVWAHSWAVLWGPPGTGKTYTVGRQVAECLADPTERVLVVSTTNKATDESALAIGRAVRGRSGSDGDLGRIVRIGKGAQFDAYQAQRLEALLAGTETDLLRQVGELSKKVHATHDAEGRAILRKDIQQLKRAMKDASFNAFASGETRVVVATAFKAIMLLNDPDVLDVLASGGTPFTTIITDEAGLLSRAAVAALSLLAGRRVILAGDSKQLAPISRISRILPTAQATWLAASGLSHLRSLDGTHEAVCLLREQHRMHPHVSAVVSHYQYDEKLADGATVRNRAYACPPLLAKQPRSIWYVLDEDGDDAPSIRAERGPGHRSWVRPKTRSVLKKLFSDDALRRAQGLFISPFVAQARDIRVFLAEERIDSWSAATVHSQQGTEADIVIFDTVNAGSTAWPFDEWKRLVNVGLSRAREFVVLLASRAEMREPYLRPLVLDMAPQVLRKAGASLVWDKVNPEVEYQVPEEVAGNPALLGHQIATRKTLRPVMSAEQQRLCGYNMDGKPRLVRGVAGSGKTAVLAHWLVKTLRRLGHSADRKIWAVFANLSLSGLIRDTIEEAWLIEGKSDPFPWDCVQLWHVSQVLDILGVRMPADDPFDYDGAARLHLARNGLESILPLCHAMFIDEAQDLGPSALQLLTRLVAQTDDSNPNARSVNIFYDNAQNIYGRRTPKWSDLGLDMRGRSFVMQESFRSTRPITEFALNVLYRLRPDELNGDHGELIDRGLVEQTRRAGEDWWTVRFNQTDGPAPLVRQFADADAEFDALGDQLVSWLKKDGVRPTDISILYNSKFVRTRLLTQVAPKLRAAGAQMEVQVSTPITRAANTLVASTAQSFKGYEAEIVVVAGADKFVARDRGVLANNLYVAMTRARSVLAVYGVKDKTEHGDRILAVMGDCLELLSEVPAVQVEETPVDVAEEVLRRIGSKHRPWLKSIMRRFAVDQDPVCAPDGEVIAEPLFWFSDGVGRYACYAEEPRQAVRHRIDDAGFRVLLPGDEVP